MEPVSILPPSVSDLERDLELALARIEHVDIPIATLWNPWECPIDVLPFLAWSLSVDMWRSDWPETVKRRVVAGSQNVHRIKGTRPAVEQAINDLGVSSELVEWFEKIPEGEPGTFELTAWVNENLVTPGEPAVLNGQLYEQLRLAVNNAKNTRSHYTFKAGARFDSGVAVSCAMPRAVGITHQKAISHQAPISGEAGLTMAGKLKAVMVIYHNMEA